ncbi:MAG: DUF370 domain-containing protein [Clostridia bacterium]|jgi:hypothetical protein|nr:DUF370 domain-containing protein [Clostridia bacterium]
MFLHVGNKKNIRICDIIGIFDADNATLSAITKQYLVRAEKQGLVDAARQEIPKSFVLYRTAQGCKITFSQLSVSALWGRIKDPSSV